MSEVTRAMDKMLRPERATAWQLVMLVLSVYVLGALAAETLLQLPDESRRLLLQIDNAICVIFLGDFFYRLYRAPRKLHFLKWNWIDFVSSIPAWEPLRIGRMVRVLRVLRALRSAKVLAGYVLKSRGGSLMAATVLTFVFITFAALAILNTEQGADSNIKSASDALWWAMTTITTVGYGDRFPVTPEGRIVASVLMILGAGMFGIVSGAVASSFLQSDQQETQTELHALQSQIGQLQEQIAFLQRKLEEENEILRLTEELCALRRALEGTPAAASQEPSSAEGRSPEDAP